MTKKHIQYTYDAIGNRSLLVDPDGGRFTYAYDSLNQISHLENPQSEATTDNSESVQNRYTYDAWGSVVASSGIDRNPFEYVGELGYYADEDTANYYVRARIYQPTLPRWKSVDLLLFIAPLFEQYQYSHNNPQLLMDETGLRPVAAPYLCTTGSGICFGTCVCEIAVLVTSRNSS